jgi:RHS repeat-associated protein
MRRHATIALLWLLSALSQTANAQLCSTPVEGWTGTFTTRTGPSVLCQDDACDINEHATGVVRMTGINALCSQLVWGGPNPEFRATVDTSFSNSCPNGGSSVTSYLDPIPRASASALNLNLTAGTYTYFSDVVADVLLRQVNCSGDLSENRVFPYSLFHAPVGAPLPPLPLPSREIITSLSDRYSVTANWDAGTLATYAMEFTLEPEYTADAECQQQAGSSIGCITQTLRETVPIVGTELSLHYNSGRSAGGGFAGMAGSAANLGGWTLSAHHAYDAINNVLMLGDSSRKNSWRLGAPVVEEGNSLITSEDGTEVYEFDASGRHLRTRWPLTGATRYTFDYDPAGSLIAVTDATGNVTSVVRDAAGRPTAIVSPYGLRTTLATDPNGFISAIVDPLGNRESFTTRADGLVLSRTDRNGNVFLYTYDTLGRLSRDEAPGSPIELRRSPLPGGIAHAVTHTSPLGRQTIYETSLRVPWVQERAILGPRSAATATETRAIVWPDGLRTTSTTSLQNDELTQSATFPDGTSTSAMLAASPRWGIQAPFVTSGTVAFGGHSASIAGSTTASLADPLEPFSLLSEQASWTLNGRTYGSSYSASQRTLTDTTPGGRTSTTVIDALERVIRTQDSGLAPTSFAYDARGRLSAVTRSNRQALFRYDSRGFLVGTSNRLGQRVAFDYDNAGRLTSVTDSDGAVTGYRYDANGNVTAVLPPGRPAHDFGYSALDQLVSYSPPAVAGTGPTTYEFNADRELVRVNRPDGTAVALDYDGPGRLISVATPSVTFAYTYDAATGNPLAAIAGGTRVDYEYDGPLPTADTWSGDVAGRVSRAFDANAWLVAQTVDGSAAVAFSYDGDGLPTQAGALSITRSAANGLPIASALGATSDTRSYSALGEIASYNASYAGQSVYSYTLKRDVGGRISGKTETIGGSTTHWAYAYDAAGRLNAVQRNGLRVATYTYDGNSNRLAATTLPLGGVSATHDGQDRLLTYGAASFAYTASGELRTRTLGGDVTSFDYDPLGNLRSVQLPDGRRIDYVVDAESRRVGKLVNGARAAGYLYDGDLLVAELDASNAIVSRFVYGASAAVPDYMVRGGVTYRIFSDPLGSPRLVIDASNGQVAARRDYDEFGNVLVDTAPGFLPFGFAGGLYDADTALVRFGARDYDPSVGRWTAKDPYLFTGGDSNLYAYALNDPLNRTDRSGLCERCKRKVKQYTAKDLVDTPKTIEKKADLLKEDTWKKAVDKAALESAKGESMLTGSGTRDYKNALKPAEKGEPGVEELWESVKDCFVNLGKGWTSDTAETPPTTNQPSVPRAGTPSVRTTTGDRARAAAAY